MSLGLGPGSGLGGLVFGAPGPLGAIWVPMAPLPGLGSSQSMKAYEFRGPLGP